MFMAEVVAPRRNLRPCPPDFDAVFVTIGRFACEEHYGAARLTVSRWIDESGGKQLLELRAAVRAKKREVFLEALASNAIVPATKIAGLGLDTVYHWRKKDPAFAAEWDRQVAQRKLSLGEMSLILKQAFPVRGEVSFTLARHAAQFIRTIRGGGWIVSPAPNGQWWVGSRRRSAKELVEFAVSKGFDPNHDGVGQDGQLDPRPHAVAANLRIKANSLRNPKGET